MKAIKLLLLKWWIPILVSFSSMLIYIIGLIIRSHFINELFPYIILFSIPFMAIFLIIQLWFKKWKIVVSYIIIGFMSYNFLVFIMYADADFYADNLKIPENIKLNKSLELKSKFAVDSLKNSTKNNLSLELVNSFQPGLYYYYFWITPKENGTIYLKIYEITKNNRLSEPRLSNRTEAQININELNIIEKRFTIYEGQWGQKYAARIEVWFIPENGKHEYKLIEKNYIVEGWMR